jgi:hypothetical protein
VSSQTNFLWRCPHCQHPSLATDPKTFTYYETKSSIDLRVDDDWEPDWVTYVFHVTIKCKSCNETLLMSGTGSPSPSWDEDGASEYTDRFEPKYCLPMPDMIEFPPKTSDEVKKELRSAFKLFWSDPCSCVNRVRTGIERLLDSLDIPKRANAKPAQPVPQTPTSTPIQVGSQSSGVGSAKKGAKKPHYYRLHERIDLFRNQDSANADLLMSIKWLGNTGTHEGIVDRDDVLSGLEILEHVLQEVVGEKSAKIQKLAKKLTKSHAPR